VGIGGDHDVAVVVGVQVQEDVTSFPSQEHQVPGVPLVVVESPYRALTGPLLAYLDVLDRRLKVMDATAISLCMDNKLPIIVFNLRRPGNMKRAVLGDPIGTVVRA